MSKDQKIITKKLNADEAERGMRVQINDHGKYQGELGEIIDIKEGCACSAGWCKVMLDREEGGENLFDEFRYGYRGDISDLLQVTKEPPRPEKKAAKLITPETVKVGIRVKIWPGSKFYGQHTGIGEITNLDKAERGWVRVEFSTGGNVYRYGKPGVEGGASDLVLV